MGRLDSLLLTHGSRIPLQIERSTQACFKILKSLKPGLSERTRHEKKLQFMAENGIRGFGPPRIGVFADKQRPEPLHCEINAWQLVINIVYQESVRRNVFDQFIKVLGPGGTINCFSHS